MNWSRTKSIFIVSFLILNLFLGYQLYAKQKSADQLATPPGELPLREELKNSDITIPEDLPELSAASYINGYKEKFEEKQIKEELEKGTDGKKIQTIAIYEDQMTISSSFKNPQEIPDEETTESYAAFLEKYVYRGEEYRFWRKNDRSITFIQVFEGRPVYSKSEDNLLQVGIKDGKMTGYTQSYIEFEQYEEKKELIKPMAAIDSLSGDLTIGSNVKLVEAGYLNLIKDPEDGEQNFVPIWHVVVGDDELTNEYFVNAINGGVQTIDEETE